jgi:ubiquinone/menaquinone biosynthesis C-methylase UbiE
MKHEHISLRNRPSAAIVREASAPYPAALQPEMEVEAPRMAWQLDLVRRTIPPGGKVMDIGGGIGPFSPSLSRAGYRTTLVDRFNDPINALHPIASLGTHDGVEIIEADATRYVPPEESFDAISCIHSIEHWHRSPKTALHAMMRALKPGGMLLIGVPNCVHLKHRIGTLFGRNKWSPLEDWYERPAFHSHVREPDVDDLRYIAKDIGLTDYRIVGRNWVVNAGPLMKVIDRLLQFRPTLCKDLYLIGFRT